LAAGYPRLWQAFQWDSMVNGSIQREWTLNLGQRDAFERLAHLLCELFVRLATAGLTNGDTCDFPLTQTDLAEATGLSTVHVNRTLRELREANLIVLKDRTLRIPQIAALKRHAMFNANYLHLEREGRHLDANFR
jgi:CRP-like cAMP-binding protein